MHRRTARLALGVVVALAAGTTWLASLVLESRPPDDGAEPRTEPPRQPPAEPATGKRNGRAVTRASAAAKPTLSPASPHALPSQRPRDYPEPAPGSHAGSHAVVPHPLDEDRSRLQAQLRLFADVDEALREADFETARRLLAEHDRRFGEREAWSDLREGYQLIADCRQSPSDETRARGARFVNEQRGSTLRRKVRRACQ